MSSVQPYENLPGIQKQTNKNWILFNGVWSAAGHCVRSTLHNLYKELIGDRDSDYIICHGGVTNVSPDKSEKVILNY